MKKKILVFTTAYLLTPAIAFAEIDTEEEVIAVFERIANWIFTIFLIAAVITFLVAAFKFLNAHSSPDKSSEAKRMLVYGMIAIAIAILANAIPFMVESVILGEERTVDRYFDAPRIDGGGPSIPPGAA